MSFCRLTSASDLSPAWDDLATCGFQRREFLSHTERHNPCAQRYYWTGTAGAVVYSLRLDLLTFLRLPSPVTLHVIGIPASVSTPGLLGAPADVNDLVRGILDRESGLVVGLNLDHPIDVDGLACGRTLPAVVIDRAFRSWDDYRSSLRSDYRRRLDRTLAESSDVESERLPCASLDDGMHALYLDVFRRSDAKLECLGPSFFRHLPPWFHLTVNRRGGRLSSWHVAGTCGTCRCFFLGGVDRAGFDAAYRRLLVGVVREAIEDGATRVQLGQTAEVPKTRLGGRIVEKGMFGWHSFPGLAWLLRQGRGLLEYRKRVPEAHVFR
jgi:hypothetical protein